MTLGVDYVTPPPASALAAAGYRFACRYVSTPGNRKNLTAGEAERLAAAGLSVVVVFETTARRALGGYAAGATDAAIALDQARACGMPTDRPIYFAVDFDAQPSELPIVLHYFDGAANAIGLDRVGGYGSYSVGAYMLAHRGASRWWQSYAWSHGKRLPQAVLFQRAGQVAIAGHTCDVNEANADDFGQWKPAHPSPIPLPPPTTGDDLMRWPTTGYAVLTINDGGAGLLDVPSVSFDKLVSVTMQTNDDLTFPDALVLPRRHPDGYVQLVGRGAPGNVGVILGHTP